MLPELVVAAARFRAEDALTPRGYKPKQPRWIVHLDAGRASIEGPYERGDIRWIPAPDRQRSGKPSKGNMKPYLVVDDARYALGLPDEGKAEEAALVHAGYLDLLGQAANATGEAALADLHGFLGSAAATQMSADVAAHDLVAFSVNGIDPAQLDSVKHFWSEYLAEELLDGDTAQCACCGRHTRTLRIMPRELVIQGQKCQLVSFNQGAFLSQGKSQGGNAPLCFSCASDAIDALDFLTRSTRHRRSLAYDRGGGSNNQLAVFWLTHRDAITSDAATYDIEDMLALTLGEDRWEEREVPPPDLSQVRRLLGAAWSANPDTLTIDAEGFHLAVLSTNKGRLIVREWLQVPFGAARRHLSRYLDSTAVTSPWGEPATPTSIRTIVDALGRKDPGLTRGLVRTAYLGHAPPAGLLHGAASALRNPRIHQNPREGWRLKALTSAITLALTHRREETMESLDPQRTSPAYLCGRLLSILERAQQVKASFKLNTTIVDRYYGAASSAPASIFGTLLRLATTAHLPDVGRTINIDVENVLSALDNAGGFPRTLSLAQQAEFALGFYHQRATYRSKRNSDNEPAPDTEGTPA